ncbi:unnamed protein product [Adineta steineri]|uniref:Potassium channel domain-containing protein n=2 Tax=Adineta steineri TaxID=433720 RepID=A0A818UU45_9BILA|nr:unnamed protein product [Adineta steineri]
MLPQQDVSMAYDGIYRNDIPTPRGNNNTRSNNANDGELDEVQTSKSRLFLKKIGKFLFSHVGLVGLVVVYAAAGGFLFELLEAHQEKLNCQEAEGELRVQLTKLKQKIVTYIQYNTTTTPAAPPSPSTSPTLTYVIERDNQSVAYDKIATMLYGYRDFVLDIGSNYRYYGGGCSSPKWTYANALLFAITIITTIGYGNITPVTWEGQICCICYATIGIPIFLLCIANISGVLGEMFRFIYGRICCGPCHRIKEHRELARKAKLAEERGVSNNQTDGNGWAAQDDNSLKKRTNTLANQANVDEDEEIEEPRVTVPLTVTMLIIAAYIWFGSMMFHSFEQWTSTQAGYFCFITLATIGFGDFVPGQGADDPAFKLIIGAIYVLFGMAILAMCFDLMQEEIVAKFRWIGRKCGIVDKDADSDSIEDNKLNNDNNSTTRPSTASSVTKGSSIMNINGKILDDDDTEYGWPTQRSSNGGTRKLSPRITSARVHPAETDSNEGTLHQRAAPNKRN